MVVLTVLVVLGVSVVLMVSLVSVAAVFSLMLLAPEHNILPCPHKLLLILQHKLAVLKGYLREGFLDPRGRGAGAEVLPDW